MTFRFIISDPFYGGLTGTDSEEVAKNYATSEDFFVYDSAQGMQLETNGDLTPIPEATKPD